MLDFMLGSNQFVCRKCKCIMQKIYILKGESLTWN